MRITVLADKIIPEQQLELLESQFTDFYEEVTEITPVFFNETWDFSDYPTFVDPDGDKRPTHEWLMQVTGDVHRRYSGEGTDHVVIFIHEDNWQSDPPGKGGIWGTAYSNVYHGYQVHYCRWDKDNLANSFGVLHHEIHHTHDTFIKTYTGVDIKPLLGVANYDTDITHGGKVPWKYIRYKENAESLTYISPYLRQAYKARHDVYVEKTNEMRKQIIKLIQKVIFYLRQQTFRKNGVAL